ncbi:MAG TPA: CvpA family protein [Bacillota bacterium]
MNFNGLDWAITGTVIFCIYRGYISGFVQQIFGFFGTIFALIMAFHFYNELGYAFSGWLNISESLGNIIGFILIAVAVSGIMGFLGMKWREHTETSTISVVDGVAGAIFGGIKVLLIWVMILLLISALPWEFLHNFIYDSQLAEDVLKLAPVFFFLQEQALPANVPRLFLSPEGLQLRKIRYEDLDLSACIACGGIVKYQGRVRKGLFYFPRFACTGCGRVSDGCQTFEGYHLFYRRCPWEGRTPHRGTNCQVWPNPAPTFPIIPCPVCGKYGSEEHPPFLPGEYSEDDENVYDEYFDLVPQPQQELFHDYSELDLQIIKDLYQYGVQLIEDQDRDYKFRRN